MDISGSHQFKAGIQQVWDALHNGALLQGCIPAAQQVTWQGDSAISVRAQVGIGPLSTSGNATVQVTQQQPPNHIVLAARSADITATATVDLASQGAGTLLSYTARADIGGPLGAVAGMAKPFVESQLQQVFACLDAKTS